jgi:hypothetical protein
VKGQASDLGYDSEGRKRVEQQERRSYIFKQGGANSTYGKCVTCAGDIPPQEIGGLAVDRLLPALSGNSLNGS